MNYLFCLIFLCPYGSWGCEGARLRSYMGRLFVNFFPGSWLYMSTGFNMLGFSRGREDALERIISVFVRLLLFNSMMSIYLIESL